MTQPSQILLGVNIDHIATIRQARGTLYPNLLDAARAAEQGGADSITVHLREDRRHIQDNDVFALNDGISTHLNLELAATAEMLAIACKLKPKACCIVPEKRAELTTEGGLDVMTLGDDFARYCSELGDSGIEVSLFIDPDLAQIKRAAAIGVPTIELHTGGYAEASGEAQTIQLQQLSTAATAAADCGLTVNAGHGLTIENVAAIAALPEINELNIGHSIVARALFTGLSNAVKEMKQALAAARS